MRVDLLCPVQNRLEPSPKDSKAFVLLSVVLAVCPSDSEVPSHVYAKSKTKQDTIPNKKWRNAGENTMIFIEECSFQTQTRNDQAQRRSGWSCLYAWRLGATSLLRNSWKAPESFRFSTCSCIYATQYVQIKSNHADLEVLALFLSVTMKVVDKSGYLSGKFLFWAAFQVFCKGRHVKYFWWHAIW